MGILKTIIKEKKANANNYIAKENFLLFGNNAKSTLVASLSDFLQGTVIELTPAGASQQLEDEYSNFHCIPIKDLKQARQYLDDIHSEFDLINLVKNILKALDVNPKNAKAQNAMRKLQTQHGKEAMDEIIEMAKMNKLPFNGISIAECSIISSWIADEVSGEFEKNRVGEDAKNLGMDWNVLKNRIKKFYQKALNLPITVILSTSEYLPSEKQNLTNIIPNFCTGSASREILDMVGNVFYTTFENGKYVVHVKSDQKSIFTKQKVEKVKTSANKLPNVIDITNQPEKLWEILEDARQNAVIKKK